MEFALQQSPRRSPSYKNIYEGRWTPTLKSGDGINFSSLVYATRTGRYKREADLVEVAFTIITSTYIRGVASGQVQIHGLPFNCAQDSQKYLGSIVWGGITKAGYTTFTPDPVWGGTFMLFWSSGSGVATTSLQVPDLVNGAQLWFEGSLKYVTGAGGAGYSAAS